MVAVEVVDTPGNGIADDVLDLAARSATVDRYTFLSDHLRLDLTTDDGPPLVARAVDDGTLVAYAQASTAHSGWIVESTVDPALRRQDPSLHERLLRALLDRLARRDPGAAVTWWIHDAGDAEAALAVSLGLTFDRELLQMTRSLPVERTSSVATRDFEIGRDEQAVLDVNNRAFATHSEQGGWTIDTMAQRERESWFDAHGLRLHERDGRLAAFCWTKLHRDASGERDEAGEIYVIAVDPDFQGLGLGSELTVAGLESIHERGVTSALLYVDAANTAAVAMYDRLGFDVSRRDRACSAILGGDDRH
ncbi:MAG: mycothiol synthase [Acidimicrobiia bacterium]|nr:mycothiol synthase [Acidimicrobiia bacterium]